MFDLSMEKLIPSAVLAGGTLVGIVAQAMPDAPVVTGIGDIGQLGAVGALIWILVRTLPAAFAQISEDRRLDRDERRADREAWFERIERLEDKFSCQGQVTKRIEQQ